MKWYHRTLSGVLAASMGFGLMGGIPGAAATNGAHVTAGTAAVAAGATGTIQATIRMDYPITPDKMAQSQGTITLYRGTAAIAEGSLCADGAALRFTDGSTAAGTVTWRTEGQQLSYIDLLISGLSAETGENQYRLQVTADGFQSYTSEVLSLSDYSQGLIFGTGDATFTQGDINGDGRVDSADVELVKDGLDTLETRADLNGDGRVDIYDLATVTMAAGAAGQAKYYQTSAILSKVVDVTEMEQALSGQLVSGSVASLFADDGQMVQLSASEGATEIALPIQLTAEHADTGVEMEQVEIVSSTGNPVEKGVVEAITTDNQTIEVPFDESTPAGVYALQTRDDGRKVVTISLGQRVPVKKITIRVDVTDNREIVVEQIKFLQDVLPENPAAENTQVQNVQAVAGTKEVRLTWDVFPNITGYKVYYGTNESQLNNVLETDRTSCTVTGLENLKTYYFAVAPVSTAGGQTWEGGKSDVVRAVPQPSSVPDKPDNVTVTAGDTLLTVTWKPGKDTQYSRVQYRIQGEDTFVVLNGQYQTSAVITGLKNDVTYEIQVFGVNGKGNGPVSLTAVGTPKLEQVDAPDLPTVNRLDNSIIVSATYPVYNTAANVSKGQLPGSVYDGDYRTSWIAETWWKDKKFTFQFDQAYEMDYLIYVPDLGPDVQNNDGRRFRDFFKAFTIWVNGEEVPASQVSYEAAKDNEYFIVKFPRTTVTTLSVQPKQWDGAGNMSLSEIAFYQYDGLADEIEALFANDSHTALSQAADAERIAALRAKAENAEAYYVDRSILLDQLDNAQQLLNGETLVVRSGFTSRSAAADQKYGQTASALQPLGISALSNQSVSLYVEGLGDGETATLVQWQQYSEAGTEAKRYALHNGRNQIYLNPIGNSGSGERGGSLYLEYSGSHADTIKIQIRDISAQKNVVTEIPLLDIAPDQWYGRSEAERKALITAYVETLRTHVAGLTFPNDSSRRTNIRNATEIATPSVLLSLPADQVLTGLGGAQADTEEMTQKLYDAICAWEQLLFLANKTQGVIANDAVFVDYRYPMQTRQYIRFSRMFSGAFMFAAGSYVGIDYPETRSMVTGYPLGQSGSGIGIDADDVNGLYGWGIAHEIGHNMDKIGYAEITNNIYSLVAQTADTGDMTGPSRLEGMYTAIFDKVALGKPGQAGDVFTQLGMYWQLHLAYDGAGNPLDGAGALDFYNAFFAKWKAGAYSDAASKDDRIALIAAEITGKDLTEFFTRWGMELSQQTKTALAEYTEETRNIWYLNDQSRRDGLNGERQAELTAAVTAAVEGEQQTKLTITVSGDADRVQGYEILRNGTPLGFLLGNGSETQTYVDTVGAANNMAFTYTVRVIDKLGYETATAESNQVRISYDQTIDADRYDIDRRENGDIVITAKEEQLLTTGGWKITGAQLPADGTYTVTVIGETGQETVAKSGSFTDNENQSGETFLAYFNKPGVEASDTRIWMYDAAQVVITGVPDYVAPSDIHLLSYPGDNIAFTEGASIGVLEQDYTYSIGGGQTETIPAGTVVVTGSYRGDPLYNSVRVAAQVQSMKPGSAEAPVVTKQTLSGETLLFAEIPEDGQVSTISDGFFLFIPENQAAFRQVNEDHGDNHAAGNLVMIALQAQMWRAETVNGDNPRMTSDILTISVPRYDSMPGIVLEQ
ncbi:M60 family metallopeptidase [Candidatus Avoscillospira sp. LCP25S3_F1]|uniref:M60 family metallopeptidase n=1 Tax=Candidatus Avoscillospira sp. LCP25S3_F1 TaxID=3438825 RepID=UPI003F92A67E